MKNYDKSVEANHYPNWPYIPSHLYGVLIIFGSRSGKTNVLLNLIKHQHVQSKSPGGHPILHWRVKLNSKNSAVKCNIKK